MMKTLKRHLSANGVLMLMGDFYREHFPDSEWFGRKTKSPLGTVTLSLEMKTPVVPFYGWHHKGFVHRLVFGRPLYLYHLYDKLQKAEALDHLNLTLEEMVRSVPEQWFYWFNAHERFRGLADAEPDSERKYPECREDSRNGYEQSYFVWRIFGRIGVQRSRRCASSGTGLGGRDGDRDRLQRTGF